MSAVTKPAKLQNVQIQLKSSGQSPTPETASSSPSPNFENMDSTSSGNFSLESHKHDT